MSSGDSCADAFGTFIVLVLVTYALVLILTVALMFIMEAL